MIDYNGKRVIVSGGGGNGMGAATVRKLVDHGAEVHVLDLVEPPVQTASFRRVDLSSETAIIDAASTIDGTVDALFNCVGVAGNRTPPVQTMVINYLGVKLLTDVLVPKMAEGSSITTITSRGGSGWAQRLDMWLDLVAQDTFTHGMKWLHERYASTNQAGDSAYRDSKEAANVWVMRSAVLLGDQGVRHNAVLPGPTTSPMYKDFFETAGRERMESFPVPLRGKPQTVTDQANALLFLGSSLASAITGELMVVDGGTNAGLATGQLAM